MNKEANAIAKKSLRSEALRARDAISAQRRHELDNHILNHLAALDLYIQSNRVLLYASYRSEVGTESMIEHALSEGKEVVLPKVDEVNACLTKHIITGMHDVCTGYRGIPEPIAGKCIKVEDVDIIIMPGVAFDPFGGRVGYGGGYYDKLLPRIKGAKPIIALAYEEQIFHDLPKETHDMDMDIIITPERIISCNG